MKLCLQISNTPLFSIEHDKKDLKKMLIENIRLVSILRAVYFKVYAENIRLGIILRSVFFKNDFDSCY